MTTRRILCIGAVIFLIYAYPGFMINESANQLVDSRLGTYTDWQPVMLALVMRVVGIVISGPPGMLVVQMLLTLIGAYQLLRRIMSDRAAAITASCILVFPPVMASTAVITTEASLVAFLLAGAAALASERFAIRVVGLVLLLIAAGMRLTGALAALPIVLVLFQWRTPQRPWLRVASALAAWIVIVGLATAVTTLAVDAREERTEVALAMSDIIGTLRYEGPLDDKAIIDVLGDLRLATSTGIQARARELYGHNWTYAVSDARLFEPMETQDQRDALYAARRAVALGYPGGYLRHRWHELYRLHGLPKARPWEPVYQQFVQHPLDAQGIAYLAHKALPQRLLTGAVAALGTTALFRPYLYFVIAIILLPLALRQRSRFANMLLASGLLYEVGLFFTALRLEYRFTHWLIVSTVLALVIVIYDRMQKAASRPPAQTLT